MSLNSYILLIFCAILISVSAKNFELCELVYELRRQGFPEYLIKDLMCLIAESSSLQSHIIRGPEPDNTFEYGLFQINDSYWCSSGPFPGKACMVRCADMLSDNITVASSCVKIILRTAGFKAWTSWRMFCKGYKLPDHNC